MCGRFWSINALAKQERPELFLQMHTVRVSGNPTAVITANGEKCKRTRKRQCAFTILDLFETVKILEDTPAVPSLRKLLENDGYSYEWTNDQKPHLIENGRKYNVTRKALH